MTKKLLLLTISLLLTVILNGCSQNQFEQYKELIKDDPSFCNDFNGEGKDWCYAFAANIRADPELCTSIFSKEIRYECFEEVAPEINDPEKCEKLRTTDEKNSCYTSVAEFHKNISYCDKISGENYYCFSVVAVASLDESLCEDSTCISTIAAVKNQPDLCKEIPNRNLRNENVDIHQSAVTRCLLINAERNNNTEICRSFTNQEDVNSCFRSIAINTQDISLCKYLRDSSGVPKVTECTIVNGEKICKEKETFLSKTDDFKILNCYSLIATDDPKQCDKVADDSMKLRNACYYQISRLNNDPSICKNIVIPMIDDVTCEKYLANHGLVATPSLI